MNSSPPHKYQINLTQVSDGTSPSFHLPKCKMKYPTTHLQLVHSTGVNFKPEASTSFQARQTSTQFTSPPCLCQERTQYRHTVRQNKHGALILCAYAATVSNRDDSATRQRKSRSAEAPKMSEYHSAHTSHTITWCLVK